MGRSTILLLLALTLGAAVGYLVGAAREAPTRTGRQPQALRPVEPAPEVLPEDSSDLAEVLHKLPVP
ncbi:MAG: hypothetical protein ACYTGZ_14925, partial [Planctomycetota bacterium]